MRLFVSFGVGLAMILGFASCNSDERSSASSKISVKEWQSIKCTHGGFHVQMPGIPKRATNSIVVKDLKIDLYSLTTEIGPTIAYAVLYFDLPSQRKDLNEEVVFSAVCTTLGEKGRMLNEHPATTSGNQGHEFEMEALNGQAHIQARLFLKKGRAFTLIVVMPNQFFTAPKKLDTPKRARMFMNYFFDSMQLTSN